MHKTACLVGNSSSAIREGALIGTPTINIGTRQNMRQRGANVIDVGHSKKEILNGIEQQLAHGSHVSESIYGDGKAGERIADVLASAQPVLQKTIAY